MTKIKLFAKTFLICAACLMPAACASILQSDGSQSSAPKYELPPVSETATVQAPAVTTADINAVPPTTVDVQVQGTAPLPDYGAPAALTLSDAAGAEGSTAFKYGSAELTPGAKAALTNFLAGLKGKQYNMIYIGGNTDSSGSAEFNLDLSQRRAAAVAAFLAAGGVPKNKITAKGFGAKHPVAPNTTAEGRAKNRRVDILVK